MITDQISSLRKEADQLGDLCLKITDKPSPMLTRAHIELMMGKAWLGKLLGNYGTPSPYPNDGSRKSIADIETTADTSRDDEWKTEVNHIQRVDSLRQRISDLVEKVKNLELGRGTWEANVSRTNAYTRLSQARFNLGFEFERIKKEETAKKK